MARDILGEYGSDSPNPQSRRASTGGEKSARDVMGYRHPQGPTSVTNPSAPGLHGQVYHCGSQSASIHGGQSGSPGIGGKRKPSGSQR